jgi:hypothetical protein
LIAVNDYFSAVMGPAVSQDTEPSLSHSSGHESPEHFRGYPYAGEYKYQNNHHKRSIVATSIPEKNAVMENERLSKGKGPKKSLFKKNKYYLETEEREKNCFC